MKNLILSLFFLCAAGAIMLRAADPWQKKAYTAWDAKDIQKILNDSPWAREVNVIVVRRAGDSEDLPRSSSPVAGAGDMGSGSGGGGMGGRGRNAGMESPGGPPAVRLVVRFVSALPVRQAMMRAQFGDEVGKSPAAAKVLSTPENYYVVGLAGLRRPPRDIQSIKEKSVLRVKGQEPFGPVQVQAEKAMIVLFFPREGHPIALEDGEVEVQVRLPDFTGPIRHTFKLKNMVYDGKLEL
jgi:hypothetical protein